jgi:hypothetical protein
MDKYRKMSDEELKQIQESISKDAHETYEGLISGKDFLGNRNKYKQLKLRLREIYFSCKKNEKDKGSSYFIAQFQPFIFDVYSRLTARTNSRSISELTQSLSIAFGDISYYLKDYLE